MAIGMEFPSTLQAARLGAEWAWSRIYRDASPAVLRYLRAHGTADAEDLLGDTFVQVVRRIATFDGSTEEQFRAWIFAIARNRMMDEWRRSARRPVEYLPPELLPDAASVDDTEVSAARRMAHQRVVATLELLSPDQRDVIFLRVIAGLPIEQVARILGKKPGAVKSLQNRGFAAIRRMSSEEAVS